MTDETKAEKTGRTTAWDEIIEPNMDKIIKWCEEGLVDEDICAMLSISTSVWYRTKKDKLEFKEAVTRAKHLPNRKVTNALFERCLGVEYDETTSEPLISVILNSLKGEARESVPELVKTLPKTVKDALVTTKVVSKLIPADIQAIKFWLMNRERKIWAKSGDQFTGDIHVTIDGLYGEPGDIPPPTPTDSITSKGTKKASTADTEDRGE
ncbi:MAG: hypothetical protein FVQ81_02140 [Candidatus Glassbacteria bacterium]|nr:hypothetical protein [Candidatus Glassbacteria bacterium]